MHLKLVGLSHRVAPIEVRERVALSSLQAENLLDALRRRRGVESAMVLATCNRLELIAGGAHSSAVGQALEGVLRERDPDAHGVIAAHLYRLEDEAVAGHLFRVAAGLDSQLVGEIQILSQLRSAAATARRHGALDAVLGGTLDRAVAAGRRARTRLRGAHAARIGDAVAATLGSRRRVLLVGSGAVAVTVASALARRGVELTVSSRNPAHAKRLASAHGGLSVPVAAIGEAFAEAEAVVTASSAPARLFTARWLRVATAPRTAPLLIVDLGVPRNVDPEAAGAAGIELLNLDDVSSAHLLSHPQAAVGEAEEVLEAELAGWRRWFTAGAGSTIAAIGGYADWVRGTELSRAMRGLESLDPVVGRRMEALSRALASKLMLHPISYLRDHPEDVEAAAALERIFGSAP